MEITTVAPIICKNCGNKFVGKYCNECGEKVYTERDRTALHFFEEGFHFITHFEGKLFTTVKTMFSKPGQVSLDYTFGIRKRYFKLLSLFLLLVVLYLLFPVFQGLNMRLYYYTHNDVFGRFATKKVLEVMREKQWTDPQVTQAFERASEKTSKFLLVILIPLTALATWAVSFKKRKYFFDQMVFATEVNSFYLLWGFLLVPFVMKLSDLVYHSITKNHFEISEDVYGLVISIPLLVFVVIASRRFYKWSITSAILFALYFFVLHTIIVHYLYKFILFVVTINQIH